MLILSANILVVFSYRLIGVVGVVKDKITLGLEARILLHSLHSVSYT